MPGCVSWCGSGSFPPRWSCKYMMLAIIDAWRLPWLHMELKQLLYVSEKECKLVSYLKECMEIFWSNRAYAWAQTTSARLCFSTTEYDVRWGHSFPPCWCHRYLTYVPHQWLMNGHYFNTIYKQSTVSNPKWTLGTRKERKLPEGMHLNLGCSWYRVSWYGWSCSTQSYPVMIRIRTASCCRTMRGTLGSHLVSMREEPPWWCHSIWGYRVLGHLLTPPHSGSGRS